MSVTITGSAQIMLTRAIALKHALRLEVKGLRASHRFNAYQIIKEEFGFKGSKQQVLEQLEAYVEQKLARVHQPQQPPVSIYDMV